LNLQNNYASYESEITDKKSDNVSEDQNNLALHQASPNARFANLAGEQFPAADQANGLPLVNFNWSSCVDGILRASSIYLDLHILRKIPAAVISTQVI
jgi:hypothetical protein